MRRDSLGRTTVEVVSDLTSFVTAGSRDSATAGAREKLESPMDSRTRRIVELGKRVSSFFADHTDQVPGDLPPLARLNEILAKVEQLMIQQSDGIKEVRSATAQKQEWRRKIRRNHLPQFGRIGEAAGVERPDLTKKLELPAEALPYLAFRSAVQGILAEAQNQMELLTRYGLVEPAPKSLADAVAKFDEAVERTERGRRAHVGARAEMAALADEILQKVRQLDGLARYRFASDVEAFAAWRSASNRFGPQRGSGAARQQGSEDVPPTAPAPAQG